MRQWSFYIRHSLRDLRRNGSRTAFALFCIATGVAAVVALRSLALMIGDELTTNLAEINRGDIRVAASDDLNPRYYDRATGGDYIFTEAGVNALRDWAADENVEIQFASALNFIQILPVNEDGTYGRPFSVVALLIEPDKWPFYGVVFSSQPAVMPLKDLFPANTRSIVISERAARDNGLQVGDEVRVGGAEEPFTISALIPDETESSILLRNGPAGFLGFIYFPLEQGAEIGVDPLPDTAYIKLPLGRSIERVDDSLTARFGDDVSRLTTRELEEQNQETADLINELILVMGLSSILIGGIGIINTMQVIVGRRTLEIAVLKTLGLKAWRVTILFMVEAGFMGLFGGLIGVIAGIILSYFVRDVGEDVLNTSLSWRAYPEAWFSGLTLGVIITLVFGFLPTLNAGQVRPATVLRPNEIKLPSAGLVRTLTALIVMIIVFGLTLNVIVSGRLELSFGAALGLGGFIVGLFSGVMLSNRGIIQPVRDEDAASIAQRGAIILPNTVAGLMLVTFSAVRFFADLHIPSMLHYGLPVLTGILLYSGINHLMRSRPEVALQIARIARQLILWGGAVILGLLVGGGLFVLISSLYAVLYPDGDASTTLQIAGVICFGIGAICTFVFRLRGSSAAGMVGLALVTAAVLSVIGFGVGDLLKAVFDGTRFWSEVKTVSVGVIVVEIITLAFAAAFVVMYGVVWLVGKTPNLGNVDVKLALRNLSTRKPRTASTMLGLIVGVGALSLITLTTSAVTSVLETRLETNAGGNVFILTRDLNTAESVKKRLESRIQGVKSFSQFQFYTGRIILINGKEPEIRGFESGDAADGNRAEFGRVENEEGIGFGFSTIDPRTNQLQFEMKKGRFFTADDVGKPYLVLREPFPGSFNDQLGLDVGSTITWLMKPPPSSGKEDFELTFTVIGIIDRDSEQFGAGDALQVPPGVVPDYMPPDSIFTIADIEDAYVDEAMVEFAQVSNVLAIELDFIVQLVERLLDQLAAIPTLVAILALVSGIAIIANTVALDTQERRRQIGIMKAVGLKGYRVLGQIMFENALIGFVAGLIGVLIGVIAVLLVGVLGEAETVKQALHLEPAFYLIGMAVAVSLLATLISAWTAARESPMEVLRYE